MSENRLIRTISSLTYCTSSSAVTRRPGLPPLVRRLRGVPRFRSLDTVFSSWSCLWWRRAAPTEPAAVGATFDRLQLVALAVADMFARPEGATQITLGTHLWTSCGKRVGPAHKAREFRGRSVEDCHTKPRNAWSGPVEVLWTSAVRKSFVSGPTGVSRRRQVSERGPVLADRRTTPGARTEAPSARNLLPWRWRHS